MILNLKVKTTLFFNCLIIFISILLGILGYNSANDGFEVALENKANADMRQAKAILDLKFPGDWHVDNGVLFKGKQKLNDAFDVVDEIGTLSGNNVTVFSGDTRVATTFQSQGKRSVGTKASQVVIDQVLNGGKGFTGEAEVLGDKYFCVYDPIKDSSGKNVGMLFMGIPRAQVDSLQSSFIQNISITIVGLLIAVGVLVAFLTSRTLKPLEEVQVAMLKIANADLSAKPLYVNGNDEISQMADATNKMQNAIKKLLKNIVDSAQKVAAAGEELTASASQTAQSIHQVADAVVEMAGNTEMQSDSLDQISQKTQSMNEEMSALAKSSEYMRKTAETTLEGVKDGHSAVGNAMDAMSKMSERMEESSKVVTNLGERSKEVGKIVETISNLADQTNLLALNAAIEAARAGEAGRGFAVVADEVRKLAEQSGSAAQNISSIISGIQNDTALAVEAMEKGNEEVNSGTYIVRQTGEVFSSIEKYVDELYEQIKASKDKISEADSNSKEVAETVDKVSNFGQAVSNEAQTVSATIQEQTAMMHDITDASTSLTELAQQLQDEVSKFKL